MTEFKMSDVLYCPEKQKNYDNTNIDSIYRYAKQIEGKTLLQILLEANLTKEELAWVYTKVKDKGLPGKIIEASYFGYKLNSRQEADFDKVGVELKSTPVDINKKNEYVAGETLSITMVDFSKDVEHDLYKSHLWEKLSFLLVIFYFRNKSLASKLDYNVYLASLFRPTDEDCLIIEQDYKIINSKIESGLAYTLSRSDGIYLSTAPKAQKNSSPVSSIYGGPSFKARCYTLSKSYIQTLLTGERVERLVRYPEELKYKPFITIIQEKFAPYLGQDIRSIAQLFDFKIDKSQRKDGTICLSKSTESGLTARMLGVCTVDTDEFRKANIKVKTIVFNCGGINKEQFRLEDADFFEINDRDDTYLIEASDENGNPCLEQYSGWEESELYSMLENKKYLFVVFQEDIFGVIRFIGTKLWSMPDEDIEKAHQDWLDIKSVLKNGVILTRDYRNGKPITKNNFPGIKDSRVIHLRPHAKKSLSVELDGSTWGNGDLSDTVPLPDGRRIVRQSYWLKAKYVRGIVSDMVTNIKNKDDDDPDEEGDYPIKEREYLIEQMKQAIKRFYLTPQEWEQRRWPANLRIFRCIFDISSNDMIWYGVDMCPCPEHWILPRVSNGYSINTPSDIIDLGNGKIQLEWGNYK